MKVYRLFSYTNALQGFNCTFKDMKDFDVSLYRDLMQVLIVPLRI